MTTSKNAAAVLAAIVGFGSVALSGAAIQPASAQVPGTFRPHAGQTGRRTGEKHPELRRALRSLERTEAQLRHSARDFGGHREKAADLCHQAEQEIQQALQTDKQ